MRQATLNKISGLERKSLAQRERLKNAAQTLFLRGLSDRDLDLLILTRYMEDGEISEPVVQEFFTAESKEAFLKRLEGRLSETFSKLRNTPLEDWPKTDEEIYSPAELVELQKILVEISGPEKTIESLRRAGGI